MLLSHRRHPLTVGTSVLALDRAITPTFILRRVELPNVVQDERVTKGALGVDTERARHRLAIVLDGETEDFVEGRTIRSERGECCFVPDGAIHQSRSGNVEILEFEWNVGSLDDGHRSSATKLKLGSRTRKTAREVADRLRSASTGASMLESAERLLLAMRAEGFAFAPGSARGSTVATPSDQALMNGIDRILSRLDENPMLVDLQSAHRQPRRTLTRRVGRLHERYALRGRGDGCWRAMRDTYRLVVATILLSQRGARASEVAGLVGYGSVEALDHAFRNIALPSPMVLQRTVLRW